MHSEHEHHKVHFQYDWMNQIWEHKYSFFAVFMLMLVVTYSVLYAFDFYPELTLEKSAPSVSASTTSTPTTGTGGVVAPPVKKLAAPIDSLPRRLIIDKLDRNVTILNPESDTVEALDTALLKGIARHPDSADFKKTGTMFLLGHSSYLPSVHNKNFQALNGIQKLSWGDKIRVHSNDTEYIYRVEKVYGVKASAASADITWGKAKIILVTCNSFGSKDDRFVVEGYLIEVRPLAAPTAT